MGKKDPRIDAYIAKSAGFAQPILKHLRELVHRSCPEAEETLKWSMPSNVYKGMLCGMAAFKQHATFGFWQHELVVGKTGEKAGMGQFGRITSLKDLPAQKVLLGYIRKAVALNEAGIKAPARTRAKPGVKRELTVPDYLVAALKKNKTAQANFEHFSYSHKKEYVEWLTGAKREETRQKRLQTARAWIAEGKSQNWKYMRC
jgi:uncharacterized protein YdeI (YjbR/CyaY-like superfamily)